MENKHLYIILIFVLCFSLLISLRISLPNELIFGDEGFYAVHGEYIAEHLKIPVKETIFSENPVFNNFFVKNPMTFLGLASFNLIGGRLGMRAFMPIVSIISASMLFLLVKKLHSTRAGVLAAIFYLTMPALITHTIFLYTEQLSLMFLISSFYFFYKYIETEGRKEIIACSILYAFSVLTEPQALLGIPIYMVSFYHYKVDWRSYFKEIATVIGVTILLITPWMIGHNYTQTGRLGFKVDTVADSLGIEVREEGNVMKKELPDIETRGFVEPQEQGGTSSPLHKFGFLNYVEFAYKMPIFLAALLGFCYYYLENKRQTWLIFLWAILFFAVTYSMMPSARVEDLSRNTLFVIAPLAIAAGYFTDKFMEWIEDKNEEVTYIVLIAIVVFSLFTIYTKAGSLERTKKFSPAFKEGCDWIRENTEEDALIYSLWGHRAKYHCKREIISNGQRGIEDAVIAANNSTYKIFSEYGIDYLYLQRFSIRRGRQKVSYPLDFVKYIGESDHYRLIHTEPRGCLQTKRRDCVIVYEVVE